jgi:hypothetical protein
MNQEPEKRLWDEVSAGHPLTEEAKKWMHDHHAQGQKIIDTLTARRTGRSKLHLSEEEDRQILTQIWRDLVSTVNDPEERAEFLQTDSDN